MPSTCGRREMVAPRPPCPSPPAPLSTVATVPPREHSFPLGTLMVNAGCMFIHCSFWDPLPAPPFAGWTIPPCFRWPERVTRTRDSALTPGKALANRVELVTLSLYPLDSCHEADSDVPTPMQRRQSLTKLSNAHHSDAQSRALSTVSCAS